MPSLQPQALLDEVVRISPYYQRSIRINDDFGNSDAISGYVCHETTRKVLANMAQQVALANQRAFTWTGPYGSGKSSLALALTAAISSDKELRKGARSVLSLDNVDSFSDAFPVTSKGWLVLPIVGGNCSISEALARAIKEKTCEEPTSSQDVLANLRALAQSKKYDGVALVIDEMGKFLEASSFDGDDIYFFQELAELSSRTNGNFLLIGILHQAFRQYAKFQRFSEQIQNEWAKVQGRFSDIPLVASTDEVVELLGNAIHASQNFTPDQKLYKDVCASISKRRPVLSSELAEKLRSSWPLHPVIALLLGPISRRQFGQNERSVFGFLGSLESHGFQEFLRSTSAEASAYYTPENYWNYLKANLEPAITVSNDSHRWAVATEAVERAEAKGGQLHASIVKNIAIIDLFKNGSGLAADNELLKTIYPTLSHKELNTILADLSEWKVIIFRKFNDAWSIFEGSDFDIEAATTEVKAQVTSFDPSEIADIANFHPVVAKRHLHLTGTLRWMGFSILSSDSLEKYIKNFTPDSSEFGQFLLVADDVKVDWQEYISKNLITSKAEFAIGVSDRRGSLVELTQELTVLKKVSERPELEGDPVAKKEVTIRLSAVKHKLESELSYSLKNAVWYSSVSPSGCQPQSLSKLASDLAGTVFDKAPKIWSELVNREKLSSNSVKARRDLLYRMLTHERNEGLDIDGFPAEKGLYLTCLKATGLHQVDPETGDWYFCEPSKADRNMLPAWQAAYELISLSEDRVSCAELYKLWGDAPFGIKAGLMPILLWSLILSCKGMLALYKDSYYVPEPSDLEVDETLQNINRFELRGIQITDERIELLSVIASVLKDVLGEQIANDPLNAARSLVKIVYGLPPWTKKTRTLSKATEKLRDCLLRASDPHTVIFHDIQTIFESTDSSVIARKLALSIQELQQAFSKQLEDLKVLLLQQLSSSKSSYEKLNKRAQNISGTSGALKLNAFIDRLKNFDGSDRAISDILFALREKSLNEWNDQDVISVRKEIAEASKKFRELEVIASVNNREQSRDAIAIVYGSPGKDFVKDFDIGQDKLEELESICNQVLQQLGAANIEKDYQFAVLARAFETLYRQGKNHG